MAKNYTFDEAVKIIAKGTDLEAITDIGRRYPVLAHKIAVVAAKAGEEFVDLMGYMPDYLTANKVNKAIRDSITESEADSDSEEKDAEETTENTDYDSMTAKELWDILGKAGKRGTAKSKKKADLVEACKQAFGGASGDIEDEAEDEAAESENAYEGKSAMELFKECKARKIKAAPKKPAKYYVDLLVKDDAAKAEAAEVESEDDDDDWDI